MASAVDLFRALGRWIQDNRAARDLIFDRCGDLLRPQMDVKVSTVTRLRMTDPYTILESHSSFSQSVFNEEFEAHCLDLYADSKLLIYVSLVIEKHNKRFSYGLECTDDRLDEAVEFLTLALPAFTVEHFQRGVLMEVTRRQVLQAAAAGPLGLRQLTEQASLFKVGHEEGFVVMRISGRQQYKFEA